MGPPEVARLKSGRSPAGETGREQPALGCFAREGFAQFTRSSRNVPIRSYRIEQRGVPAHGTTQISTCYVTYRIEEERYRIGELVEPSRITGGEGRSLTPFMDGLACNRKGPR